MGTQAAIAPQAEIATDDRLRFLANMPGRYYLEKWHKSDGPRVSSFSCRIQRISPTNLTVAAPVGGETGDRAVCHFDEFGVLAGTIARPMGFGFVLTLDLSAPERNRLATKIRWFERRKNFEVPDMRAFRRIVPRNPQSSIILADGTRMGCFVIDMSVSGAAISADIAPEIGMPLALGNVVGRVVRTLDPGFAISFLQPVALNMLEARLIKPLGINSVEIA